MRYFYDRETDAVSFTLSEVFDWTGSEDLNGGTITVHLDRRRRPFAVEVRNASKIVNTFGLQFMKESPISHDEISRRMSWSDAGRQAWSTIVRRMLVPQYTPRAPQPMAVAR
jgi:uncharacterized protein YuzE